MNQQHRDTREAALSDTYGTAKNDSMISGCHLPVDDRLNPDGMRVVPVAGAIDEKLQQLNS